MIKMTLPYNPDNQTTDYYLGSTNIKGVETYAPPRETLQFLSDLNKLEFLGKHPDRAAYRAQLGAVTIEHLVQSMTTYDGDNATFQDQFRAAAYRKFAKSPFLTEALNCYWGGIGEYTAYRLFEQFNKQGDFQFNFERADLEDDLLGIDAWVTPDNQLPEYQNQQGQVRRLALSIKHVANLPSDINDIVYPLRDMHDIDSIVNSLGTDLQCYSSPAYTRDELLNCRVGLRNSMDKAFWRFQGYIPDSRSEGGWKKAQPSIEEIYGDTVIPTLLLTSQNRKKDGETLIVEDQNYTLEAQIADNPDKWV